MNAPRPVQVLHDAAQAGLLFHPLRLRILEESQEPASATEIARRIGETPQKVNYHVTTLAGAGLLDLHDERRHRNLVERRYRATARRYVLSPEVLGPLGLPIEPADSDAFSAVRLLGLTALVQRELGAGLAGRAADTGADPLPSLSIDVELRFDSAAERARFADEARQAVLDLAARYGPSRSEPGGGEGRPYRLVVGCYPVPEDTPTRESTEENP